MSQVFTAYEFKTQVVDVATDSTNVGTKVKGLLRGVYVNTSLSAHTVVLKDNTTAMFTIPASTPAGTFIPFGDAVYESGLVVDPDNAATGSITVVYREDVSSADV